MPDSTMLLSFLGRLHVAVVHFPIALLLVAAWFEFVGLQRSREQRTWAVRSCLTLGLLSAALTAASGWQLAEHEPLGRSVADTLFWHRWTGVTVGGLALLALILGLRRRGENGSAPRFFRPVLLVAAVLASVAGHLGGSLVHGADYLFPAAPAAVPDLPPAAEAPAGAPEDAPADAPATSTVDYATQIQPLFAARCYECHGESKGKGKLRLHDMEALFARPDARLMILPGYPLLSAVYQRVSLPHDDLDIMPAEGDPLNPEQIELIRLWIEQGAHWAPDETGHLAPPGALPAAPATPVAVSPTPAALVAAATAPVEFDRDVRPLLADNCFTCHGPDEGARQAGLRLDVFEGATAPLRHGGSAVAPHDAAASELLQRVTAADVDERMPPGSAAEPLTDEQVATLRRWIEDGAAYTAHWAFLPPRRAELPALDPRWQDWPRDDLDRFVLAAMQDRGLEPSPEAPDAAWLRRVSLDLTGLPPTPEELDAFEADAGPGARGRVLDRLFASPRYGEHMATAWLDAARYADTHGYHYDNERSMWPWRDWVVEAFNANMPFDRFTHEQLAGDLLPDATLQQRIASGFNRNHPINWEGGIIPEEYQTEYVVDRVSTTSTVWMGLTLGCARCHDHKFDPMSQEEFYAFYDVFNQVPEQGADGQAGNAEPFVHVPAAEQAERLAALESEWTAVNDWLEQPRPELDAAQQAWEASLDPAETSAWRVLTPFTAHARGADVALLPDGSVLAEGEHPADEVYDVTAFTRGTGLTALRLEGLADERLPKGGPGRAFHANIVLSEIEVEIAPLDAPDQRRRLTFSGAHADHSQPGFHVSRAADGDPATGWALEGGGYGVDRVAVFVADEPFGFEGGTAVHVRLAHESDYEQHALGRFRLSVTDDDDAGLQPSRAGPWLMAGPYTADTGALAYETAFAPEHGVDLAAAAAELWTERADLQDGAVHSLEGERSATYLWREVTAPSVRELTLSLGSDDALKLWVNGELSHVNDSARSVARDQDIVRVRLREGRNELLLKIVDYGGDSGFYFLRLEDDGLPLPLRVSRVLALSADERDEPQRAVVREHFRRRHAPEWQERSRRLVSLTARLDALRASIPTTMVMARLDEPRPTHVLERGAYDRPAAAVSAGVPAVLPPLPAGPADRLALARWLTDPGHPLTARVAVNRLWQQMLGRGLVTTPDDFGTQGARPSHPELLDQLALEFVESGWDVQALLRRVALSATYRQDSAVDGRRLALDPDNVWLSRGARFRLPAETLRDNALFVSGLLVETVGGPPVKPYQPEGLWREVGSDFGAFSANVYEPDEGDALYRRSLYTFRKRSVPPPMLQLFDAPTRESCTVSRQRTNTPLQALALLNDPTFVEASRVLAGRVMTERDTEDERLDRLFRLVLSRRPDDPERTLLRELLHEQQAGWRADAAGVQAFLAVGASSPQAGLAADEHAAWAVVAGVLLNLDEAVTRS